MSEHPYRLSEETAKRLGLIVLQVDETVEHDLMRILPEDTSRLLVTRIPSGAELTPETIHQMGHDLTGAAALLPDAPFDVIAYACTSGTTLLGAEAVAARVRAGRRTAEVTNPLTAAFAAVNAVGARSMAIVSPYIAPVAGPIRDAFRATGIDVPATISFGEKIEARVARIDPTSVEEAALRVLERSDADCVFLSCTNLRTLDIIEALEAKTGRTVLSSNQVLGWHMARLAGIDTSDASPGRLFRTRS